MKWFEIEDYKNKFKPLTIFIGGRGIGKTYSSISFLINSGKPFIYLRNNATELDESASIMGNPFKAYNDDHGTNYKLIAEKKHYLIVEAKPDPEDPDKEVYRNIGYAGALSTFENLRGVDFSDVDYVFLDEFITVRTLSFNQFSAFIKMYETVARNRELQGRDPLICILCSNSQNLYNQILQGFNLVSVIENMMRIGQISASGQDYYINLCKDQEVSNAKRNTALYRLTAGTREYQESIENSFSNNDFSNVGTRDLKEYKPVCQYEDIYIYLHKSMNNIYISWRSASCKQFSKNQHLMFMKYIGATIRTYIANGECYFSDMLIKNKISEIIGL